MTRIHLPVTLNEGDEHDLPEAAHRHLVQVLRLRAGEALTVFDGRGCEAPAALITAEKRHGRIRVGAVQRPMRESPLAVTLLQGISKGERMDYTLQKAVELGVTAIQPLTTQRSMVKLDADRWAKKYAHWQGVVVSACEQSGRVVLPSLHPPTGVDAALKALPGQTLRLALLPEHGRALRSLPPPEAGVVLLVGPEGGLDSTEIHLALDAGFTAVQLGPRVLRTETAGVATLAALQALWGDWGDL